MDLTTDKLVEITARIEDRSLEDIEWLVLEIKRLRAVLARQVDSRVIETFDTEDVAQNWLHRPNPFLGGTTPMHALHNGYADRVLAVLEALDSGVFI